MKFLVLLYGDESKMPARDSHEHARQLAAYGQFFEEVNRAGVLRAGDPVQGPSTATTVRVRDGATHTSPGPFSPGPEQLIGFYVLDCDDRSQAEAYAAKIPAAAEGAVEVRPIMVF